MARLRDARTVHIAGPLLAVLLALVIVVGAAAFTRVVERSSSTVRFGAYSPPAPEAGLAATDDLQRAIGRPVDIVLWYQQWGGENAPFRSDWVSTVTGSGRIPLLTWEPWVPGSADQPQFALRRIASGAFDDYIRSWALGLKALRTVVYLRPMHEMNGNWYPWGGTVNGNSPKAYVAAWRRMWRIFHDAGANNVRWVWSPLAEDVPATAANRFERYYPGAAYVDVLGLDGYNWGSEFPQYGGWRSFGSIFDRAYARIARLGSQPIWITETASAPEGGDKAQWVRDMFGWSARKPRLAAIVWFNVLKERDWRATSPPGVAAAFGPSAG